MPKRKPPAPTSNLTLALTFAFFSVLGYLGISQITSSGLFSSNTINYMIVEEAPNTATEQQKDDVKKLNQAVTQAERNKDSDRQQALDAKVNEAAKTVNTARTTKEEVPTDYKKAPTINTTPTSEQTNSSATCPGGNGTVIPAGMWVATGGTYNEDSSQRRCVQCGENGRYDNAEGKDQSCSDAYANNPSHTILPNNAGDPYTNGAATLSSCYRGAVVYPNGALNSDQRCYNGGWLELDDKRIEEYNDFMNKLCTSMKLVFDKDVNECQASTEPEEIAVEDQVGEENNDAQDNFDKIKNHCEEVEKGNKEGAHEWTTCSITGNYYIQKTENCDSPNSFTSSGVCNNGREAGKEDGTSADKIIDSYKDRNLQDIIISVRIPATTTYSSDPEDCAPNTNPRLISIPGGGIRFSCIPTDSDSDSVTQTETSTKKIVRAASIPGDCIGKEVFQYNDKSTPSLGGICVSTQLKITSPSILDNSKNNVSWFDDVWLFSKPEGSVCTIADFQCSGDLVCENRRCTTKSTTLNPSTQESSTYNPVQQGKISAEIKHSDGNIYFCTGSISKSSTGNNQDCLYGCSPNNGQCYSKVNQSDNNDKKTDDKVMDEQLQSSITQWWDDAKLWSKPVGSVCTIGNWQCKGELVCTNRRCTTDTTSTISPTTTIDEGEKFDPPIYNRLSTGYEKAPVPQGAIHPIYGANPDVNKSLCGQKLDDIGKSESHKCLDTEDGWIYIVPKE